MRILDMGSGNTCKNNEKIIKKMIDVIAEIDRNKIFILKWQLFTKEGENIPLDYKCFDFAFNYAKNLGYKTTASIFDINTLKFLLTYDVPFIKIASRPDLYWLGQEIARKIMIIESHSFLPFPTPVFSDKKYLCCISDYPATTKQYKKEHLLLNLKRGISDHTTNWDLFYAYKPDIYECHFCLEHNEQNPDGGLFSRTPKQLQEIL